ncbi:OLC1v1024496C2 [Oldenlandia corymbosa var. corymbosa]|nr:OLC1v1024496C2 [Oldenlandia corymbosa var. corymbosa]
MVDLGLDPEEFLRTGELIAFVDLNSFEEQLSVFVEALAEYFRGRRERDALIAKTREKSEKRYRTVLTKPSSGILTKKRFMTQAKAVGASYAAAVASPVDDSESDRMKVDEEASSCKSKEL